MQGFADFFWTSPEGLPLHARDYAPKGRAEKLPVICIHGLTRNARDFEDLAPRIAATGRRVLAVDVRGRGLSAHEPNPMNYHPGTYAADVVSLLQAAGVERAVFVGTSMGGLITMVLTSIAPQAIAAAVLNDVGPALSPRGLQRIAGYAGKGEQFTDWAQAADYLRSINAVAFPENSEQEWQRWARRAFREDAEGRLQMRYDPNIAVPIRANKLKASSMAASFAFRRLARRRPTLLIRGGLSDLIEPEQASAMRAAAPRMQYAEVPNIGHAPMLNEPAAREALGSFLASVD